MMTTTTTTMTTTISTLPDGIMLDILSRLCIQDLSPCIFVCKDWYTIIKDPVFVNFHHSRIDQYDPTFIIIHSESFGRGEELFLVDDKRMSTEPIVKPIRRCFPFRLPPNLYIVGSSNGLLCLKLLAERYYYILNPITNEIVPLPIALPPHVDGPEYQYFPSYTSGFAFDATSKTYKVVQTSWYLKNKEAVLVFDMHTIGSGKWTRVHEISDAAACGIHETAVFVNNALHWQIKNHQYHICAMDVGTETFTRFKNPHEYNHTCLGLIKARLALFSHGFSGDLLVWVMKDYGVEESWAKEYTICLHSLPGFFENNGTRILIMSCFKILFYGEHLSYYCFEKKEYRVINTHGHPTREFWGYTSVVAHVGSLVSPKSIVAGKELNVG